MNIASLSRHGGTIAKGALELLKTHLKEREATKALTAVGDLLATKSSGFKLPAIEGPEGMKRWLANRLATTEAKTGSYGTPSAIKADAADAIMKLLKSLRENK